MHLKGSFIQIFLQRRRAHHFPSTTSLQILGPSCMGHNKILSPSSQTFEILCTSLSTNKKFPLWGKFQVEKVEEEAGKKSSWMEEYTLLSVNERVSKSVKEGTIDLIEKYSPPASL